MLVFSIAVNQERCVDEKICLSRIAEGSASHPTFECERIQDRVWPAIKDGHYYCRLHSPGSHSIVADGNEVDRQQCFLLVTPELPMDRRLADLENLENAVSMEIRLADLELEIGDSMEIGDSVVPNRPYFFHQCRMLLLSRQTKPSRPCPAAPVAYVAFFRLAFAFVPPLTPCGCS